MKMTNLVHIYWEKIVCPGDTVVDATVGNGHDTLALARLLKGQGTLIGYDIQEQALQNARERLGSIPAILRCASHEALEVQNVKLIVYNLGYLPGGDKEITTTSTSTLKSLAHAQTCLCPGGAISVTAYSGHEEGAKEEEEIYRWASTLAKNEWCVIHQRLINRESAPSHFLIMKTR